MFILMSLIHAFCPLDSAHLCDVAIRSLKSRLNALRGFKGVLDGRLQEVDGELLMHLCCHP